MSVMPQSRPFQVMLKPRGPICNLDCRYCYYLSKERLYPDSQFRMSDALLEDFVRQYIASQPGPEVVFVWQGGEPLLMGLDFYRRALTLQKKYARPGLRVANVLQTNGVLLDDAWCAFFKQHDFLVGISLDGPAELHDVYRRGKGGQPTFARVMAGLRCLQRHLVEYNVLTSVHAANMHHPLHVYHFLRDEVGARFLQFIPIVERVNETGFQEGERVTAHSVTARQYGQFLIAIFDEWVRHDVGQVFVQIFDVALGQWLGAPPGLCVFAPTCGYALALEHNGDLYSCDHFVEPTHFLGNIQETPLRELVVSPQQQRFGAAKADTLPHYCQTCEVRFACNGGCPKNRFITTPQGEPGLNYLCAGYQAFFRHIDHSMRLMADLLQHRRPPAQIMTILAQEDAVLQAAFARAKRNDPCPCGSGLKFKHCHGRKL